MAVKSRPLILNCRENVFLLELLWSSGGERGYGVFRRYSHFEVEVCIGRTVVEATEQATWSCFFLAYESLLVGKILAWTVMLIG